MFRCSPWRLGVQMWFQIKPAQLGSHAMASTIGAGRYESQIVVQVRYLQRRLEQILGMSEKSRLLPPPKKKVWFRWGRIFYGESPCGVKAGARCMWQMPITGKIQEGLGCVMALCGRESLGAMEKPCEYGVHVYHTFAVWYSTLTYLLFFLLTCRSIHTSVHLSIHPCFYLYENLYRIYIYIDR